MRRVLLFIYTVLSVHFIIGQTILGIDVSHHQGGIDWNQVYADGKIFAFVKSTEGMTYTDPMFFTNMNNGNNAGVIMGAYHFARPDNNTAAQDAGNFLSAAEPYTGQGFLPPVLDLEDPASGTSLSSLFTSSELTAWVQDWLTIVENQTGVAPIIYTNAYYANYLESSINTYGLWIANPYTSPSTPPANIGVWDDWLFKQYSWVGSVSGISGDVDLNVFNGTVDDFSDLTGGSFIVTNDTCEDAINIQSFPSCNPTEGTVFAATPGDLDKASCDVYPGTPLAADVFYKFTATRDTHTIEVSPNNDLYAIVSLYEGVDCNNLNEVACSMPSGGIGSSTTITANSLTVGDIYRIRIYHYGNSSPTNGGFNVCITHTGSDDLFVSNSSVSPLTVDAGQDVTAECDFEYSGSILATNLPDFNIGFFLSEDCLFDDSDTYLSHSSSDLGSDNTSSHVIVALTIPEDTYQGTYNLLFVADYDGILGETDETNNIGCVEITVNNNISVEETTLQNSINLFPNPTNRILNFDTTHTIKHLNIYNLQGKLCLSLENPEKNIDISEFTEGIYFVRFSDENNNQAVFRVVKQ